MAGIGTPSSPLKMAGRSAGCIICCGGSARAEDRCCSWLVPVGLVSSPWQLDLTSKPNPLLTMVRRLPQPGRSGSHCPPAGLVERCLGLFLCRPRGRGERFLAPPLGLVQPAGDFPVLPLASSRHSHCRRRLCAWRRIPTRSHCGLVVSACLRVELAALPQDRRREQLLPVPSAGCKEARQAGRTRHSSREHPDARGGSELEQRCAPFLDKQSNAPPQVLLAWVSWGSSGHRQVRRDERLRAVEQEPKLAPAASECSRSAARAQGSQVWFFTVAISKRALWIGTVAMKKVRLGCCCRHPDLPMQTDLDGDQRLGFGALLDMSRSALELSGLTD
eukprot:750676-Hanusia_phi.AAC.2